MRNHEFGVRYDMAAIAPIEEDTTYFDAGPIRLGLEYRELNPDIVGVHRAGDQLSEEELGKFVDNGFSVHVFDAETKFEYLRFDCFANDPHYHYHYKQHLIVVPFDGYANGDMWTWVVAAIRGHLPQMLEYADAADLAGRVDQARLESALDAMDEAQQAKSAVLAQV